MEFKALYFSLGLFLLAGIILNGVYLSFPSSTHDTFLSDFVENGLQLGIIGEAITSILPNALNPFGWFGDTIHNFFISQARAFSILPNALLIPLFILIFAGILYTIIGWIRGV